jgi:wobble nucleotide-excising tRNase
MINKITQIKNLAVFDDFLWDKSVIDDKGKIIIFDKINIIYGRNYSGKTTLSKIFRAFETRSSLDKYDNPIFVLQKDDGKIITQNNITDEQLPVIRVFNNDFIRDNLTFIINPDESIKPFAILGDDNKKIEDEINYLESELGSSTEEKETGLYAELKDILHELKDVQNSCSELEKDIDKQRKKIALDPTTGIKYKPNIYGDQIYNVPKLEEDINKLLSSTYNPIDDESKTFLVNSLSETQKMQINPFPNHTLYFNDLCTSTEQLITKKIGVSGKIPELIREVVLTEWVKKGYELHKDKRSECAFCGGKISSDRWSQLDKHFDEESKKLETDIELHIEQIKKHKLEMESIIIDEQIFYNVFHKYIIELKNEYKLYINKYCFSLDKMINQLTKRKNAITVDFDFEKPDDVSAVINELLSKYELKRKESNEYSDKLSAEQKGIRERLRLQKVYEFITTSGYIKEIENLKEFQKKKIEQEQEVERINKLIREKEEAIQNKKRLLNDEEKGAIKVNEYLTDYFGHEFLSLQAIKNEEEPDGVKTHFRIIRNGNQAFNLSEGECSLIAFCYFVAKLNDIETKGRKAIIWIDDPVSSLDNNHIFFIYSLIRAEIVDIEKYEQLFISTHNLNFLKYLKRFKKKNEEKGYFMVYRQHKKAIINKMPSYLIKYVTEFNFLFNEIYKCTLIEDENDNNHNIFYNFGNNARKFLEIYLYYKYPDDTKEFEKMKNFFSKNKIPSFLSDRINNEYSHLSGVFERGAIPIEVPEMRKAATLIIETLEKKDKEQFSALLNSIGIKYEDYKKKRVSQINTSNISKDIDLFTEEELKKDDK